MTKILITVVLLTISNLFMTLAWYGHLRNLKHSSVFIAILVSWGIALFEYMVQVPANRIGIEKMSLSQLKILQEVISLSIFVPFAVYYMKSPVGWNYGAAYLCIIGAVFFIFWGK